MERFTEKKRQLSEMVKLLIMLYYQMKVHEKLTDAAIAALEGFLRGVTGRTFKYDEKGGLSDVAEPYTFENFATENNREQFSIGEGDADTGTLSAGRNKIFNKINEKEGLTDKAVAKFEDFLQGIGGVVFKHHEKGLPLDDGHSNGTGERSAGDFESQIACPDDADKGALVGHYKISATTTQFKSFMQAMALLEKSKVPVHFILSGIQDTVDTSFLLAEQECCPDEDGEGGNVGTVGKVQEIHWADMDDINKKINAAINNQEPQKIKYQKVAINSIPYRVYTVAPVSEFAWTLLKAEPMEDNPCQILPIKLVSEKPGERTVNQISQQDGQREDVSDQSAFMEAIKQNLREKKTDRLSHQSVIADPKEEKPSITDIIEAMKAELRKLPPAQIPQRIITIKSNRWEYPQSSSHQESIIVEPQEESSAHDPQQPRQSWISFIQIARAVLVNFHISFGSFERIKNCQECGKLFFEKKEGSRFYCSSICKKRYSDKLFGIEKQRCMENQNAKLERLNSNLNINSNKIKRHRLQKYHCENCQIDPKPKGGECPILIERNKKLFDKLASLGLITKKNT